MDQSVFEFFRAFGSLCIILCLCYIVGFALIFPFRSQTRVDIALASPIIGFGWISVLATWGYRLGFTPTIGVIFAVVLASVPLLYSARHRDWQSCNAIWKDKVFLFITLITFVILDLPNVVSVANFRVFQGNPVDQMNYMGITQAVTSYSYDYLSSLRDTKDPLNDFLSTSSISLGQRPSLNIFHSAVGFAFFGPLVTTPSMLMTFLQMLVYFSGVLFLRTLRRVQPVWSYVIAASCAVGFFTQYIIDINAWGQIGSISLVILLIIVATDLFSRFERNIRSPLLPVKIALVSAVLVPILYIYPEMSIVTLAALGSSIVVASLYRHERSIFLQGSLVLVGAAAISLLLCLPYFAGTISFMIGQIKFSAQPNNWHLQFQKYIFYASDVETQYHGIYAAFSWPVDALYGALGMYFLRAPASLPLIAKVAWKIVLYVPLIVIARSLYRWTRSEFKSRSRVPDSYLQAAGATLVLIGFIIFAKGQFWASGKFLAEFGPMMFLTICAALMLSGRKTIVVISTLGLILTSQLAFAVARIAAALNQSGSTHISPAYPSALTAQLKNFVDFDLTAFTDKQKSCNHTAVTLSQPYLDHYAQLALVSMAMPWTSTRPINDYYGFVPDRGMQAQAPSDCYLTEQLDNAGHNHLDLETDSEHLARVATRRSRLVGEIAIRQPEGADTSGMYASERFQGEDLRWTNGDAKIDLGEWGTGGSGIIHFTLWDIPPIEGSSFSIIANGQTIYSGIIGHKENEGFATLPDVPEKGSLLIEIRSSVFHQEGDPRSLGIAIKSFNLSRDDKPPPDLSVSHRN